MPRKPSGSLPLKSGDLVSVRVGSEVVNATVTRARPHTVTAKSKTARTVIRVGEDGEERVLTVEVERTDAAGRPLLED